ncbi:MAG: enoyl-CoA hydratase/isomerase family protein [Candidatus Aminicenantes bacterium]|nr:enoyl-CoA hydratase/isomerase family protein [Candidatus Aminicenantes bacterium]
MSDGRLRLSREGRLLVATIDNPPENRLTPGLLDEMGGALDILLSEMDAAILTGTGTSFSYGFDLEVFRRWPDADGARRDLERGNGLLNRLARCPKPVIAAVNGHCFGGGLEVALACHFRLCSEKARLGLPELSIGLIPGLGGIRRLASLIGRAKALELVALGDIVTAQEALRLGLVNRVFSKNGFSAGVRAFAQALALADPALLRETIRLAGLDPGISEEEATDDLIRTFLRFRPGPPDKGS